MKKMGLVAGMSIAGLIGFGTYILTNKETKPKANKLINNVLDKANDMTNNMIK